MYFQCLQNEGCRSLRGPASRSFRLRARTASRLVLGRFPASAWAGFATSGSPVPPLYRSVPRPERFAAVGPNPERDGSGDGGLGKPASSQADAVSPFRPDSLSDREAGTPGSGAERERRGAARCPEVELVGAALGGVCGFGAGARLRRPYASSASMAGDPAVFRESSASGAGWAAEQRA